MIPGPGVIPSLASGQRPAGAPAGYTGVLFVCADTGSDANTGLTPQSPLKNLDTAYNMTAGSRNEIIYVIGGSAAVTYSSLVASGGSGLVWSKSFTHCIGLDSGPIIGQRARITNGVSTNLLTPLLSLTGSGCLFQNLEFFNGGAHATSAAVCIAITGSRNSFINCQISGGGDALNGADASCRSLTITGTGGENFFKHCYIGLDTISRAAASSEIALATGTVRNVFEDCVISTYGTGSNLFMTVAASGIDRFLLFRNCQFMNASVLSGGTALTNAFSISGTAGGVVLLTTCLIVGATATTSTKTCLYFDNAYATATTSKAVIAGW